MIPDTLSALSGIRLSLHNRVQLLIRAGDLDNASTVTRHSLLFNTRPTVFTCNELIRSMYRAERYLDAIALFTYFFKQSNIAPNVVSYNFLIASYCENGEVDKALEVYQHIRDNAPFTPSRVTFRHLTKGLIDAGRIKEAESLLWKMVLHGYATDSIVFRNIICGFLYLENNLEKANEYFDELKLRCTVYDGIVNAAFMEWFFSKGKPKEALKCYKSLLDENFEIVPDTWNVLLRVLLKWGQTLEAEALFNNVLDRYNPPVSVAVNTDTFNIMVNECFKRGKGSEAYNVFKKVGKAPKSRDFCMTIPGYSNIIMRYCENDMIDDAEKMFVEFCGEPYSSPSAHMYKALIDAYFEVGRLNEAINMYTEMVETKYCRVIPTDANKWFMNMIEHGRIMECGPILTKMGKGNLVLPDATTYDIVIRACCGASIYDTSLVLLQQMVSNGVGVAPILKDYVLEVFGKIGRQKEIYQILNAK